VPVIPLELPAYQRKENWGAAETFYRWCAPRRQARRAAREGAAPRCNLLGPTALGFRHRDDVREITQLLAAWASRSMSSPRWAPRRPTSPGWPRPTSTSCSTPRSPRRPPPG
jgi:hypothetical protein